MLQSSLGVEAVKPFDMEVCPVLLPGVTDLFPVRHDEDLLELHCDAT